MKHALNFELLQPQSKSYKLSVIADAPGKCPICQAAYYPHTIHAFGLKCDNKHSLAGSNPMDIFALYFCPNCKNAFVSKYWIYNYANNYDNTAHRQWDAPDRSASFEPEIDPMLKELSPGFAKMYGQAYKSEHSGSPELAGMGYRAALEYLVKDYLLLNCTDEQKKTTVLKLTLSAAISELKDPLSSLALSVAWIGNDFTHYVQKHPEMDISDLKNFLSATMRYISYQLTISKASEFIKTSKK